ncbi:DNA polymerase III subunit beta family protein [Thiomonas sp.]
MAQFQFPRDTAYPIVHLVASCAGTPGGVGDMALRLDISATEVRLTANNGALRLSALLPDVQVLADAKTPLPCAIHIPAEKLVSVLKPIPKGTEVKAALEPGKLALRAGKSKFSLTVLSDNHPALEPRKADSVASGAVAVLPGAQLARHLEQVLVSAGKQDARAILNGVYLELLQNPDGYRMTASDGRRLAHVEVELPQGSISREDACILPVTNLATLIKAAGSAETVECLLDEHGLRLRTPSLLLETNRIDGEYLAYERALPHRDAGSLELDSAEFLDCLKQVAPLTNPDAPSLQLTTDGDTLTIRSRPGAVSAQEEAVAEMTVTPAVGNPEVCPPGEPRDACPLELGVLLNRDYLLDSGKVLSPGRWRVYYRDASSAVELTDGETRYIVMAMRQ